MQKGRESKIDRRGFMRRSSIIGAGLAALGAPTYLPAAGSPNEKVVAGVMGLGRGLDLIRSALQLPDIRIAYVCDVDKNRIDRAAVSVRKKYPTKGVVDFRRILDDSAVDLLFIATCNHWHAPATILACTAGKHVYVEKPGSHNPREGELMVEAVRKHGRVVQMGNQRRSWARIIEGITRVQAGIVGPIRFARCWYNNRRPSIGRGKPVQVPPNLDYSLWQGPAPEQPYKDNLIHYNWHWHWHWGNGELGNNGVHALDLARWGLGVDYPIRITYTGGRYHYDDDQETPDSGTAVFDFGDRGATWEGSSCHPRKQENLSFVTFYGDQGSVALSSSDYRIFDLEGKQIPSRSEVSRPPADRDHIANLLDCIRTGKRPNSVIDDAQKSTLLCHLGNIAYRTGRTIHFDPARRKIVDCKEAATFWERDYRPGWEPRI